MYDAKRTKGLKPFKKGKASGRPKGSKGRITKIREESLHEVCDKILGIAAKMGGYTSIYQLLANRVLKSDKAMIYMVEGRFGKIPDEIRQHTEIILNLGEKGDESQ